MNFLASLRDAGLKKSAITTAKAAVINLWILTDGVRVESQLLTLFMRGIAQLEPVKRKVQGIWDPTVVLQLFEKWPKNTELSLLQLTQKCAMLVALATAQRVQTLRSLTTKNLTITQNAVAFSVDTRLKQTTGDRVTPLLYLPRMQNEKVCVWNCVLTYFLRTKKLRQADQFFVISRPPHRAATSSTISRWLRDILQLAGINVALYKAHSTRSAASSKAKKFVPLDKVLEAADWRGATVFEKFYNRTVSGRGEFAEAVWHK